MAIGDEDPAAAGQDGVNQASPFTVPTNPQEEIRLLRARIAQVHQRDPRCVPHLLSIWCRVVQVDFDWRKISCQCATKMSYDGCRIVRPTCKKQLWQATHTRWPGCAASWALQPQVGRQSLCRLPRCPTQSSDEDGSDVGLSWSQSWGSVEPRPCSHPPGQEIGEVHADGRLI